MKKDDNENIKQDINFLDRPLWIPIKGNKTHQKYVLQIGNYTFESYMGAPNKFDMMILYYLLLQSQENRYNQYVKNISFYQILKGCNIHQTKKTKERLIESLERWKRVIISFQGVFFDNKEYKSANFNIINEWWNYDNKYITIEFGKSWIETIKKSNFFKYISFTEMKHLRSPVSIRLYEILSKSFYKRNEWKIGVQKLSQKIPLQESYYSTIKRKIESGINTINRKTDLNINVETHKTKKNDGVFTFKKIQPSMMDIMKESQKETFLPDYQEIENYDDFIKDINEKTLQELQQKFIETDIENNPVLKQRYKKNGFDNITIQNSFISYVKRQKNNP